MLPRVQTLAANSARKKRAPDGRPLLQKRMNGGRDDAAEGLTRAAAPNRDEPRPKKNTDRLRAARRAGSVRAGVESDRDRAPAAPGGATTGPQGPANGRGIACGRGRGDGSTTAATATLPAPATAPPAVAGGPTPAGAPRPRPGPVSVDPRPRPRRNAPAVSPTAKAPPRSASPGTATPTTRTTTNPHHWRRRRRRWPGKLPSKPRIRNYPSPLETPAQQAGPLRPASSRFVGRRIASKA